MTWKGTTKEIKSTLLVEEDAQSQFNDLQEDFLLFIKTYNSVVEYDSKLDNIGKKEYKKIKDNLYLFSNNNAKANPDKLDCQTAKKHQF